MEGRRWDRLFTMHGSVNWVHCGARDRLEVGIAKQGESCKIALRTAANTVPAAGASLAERLNRATIPTQPNPFRVDPAAVEATQDAIGAQLRQVIVDHSRDLVAQMEADRTARSAPAAYAAVCAQAPTAEW
jgi:hypothetical protein